MKAFQYVYASASAALFVLAASGCSDPDASTGDADNLTSCDGAALDAHGICRTKTGQFAKKSGCAGPPIRPLGWTTEEAGKVAVTGNTSTVRLDAQGALHLLFNEYRSPGQSITQPVLDLVHHAVREGGAWHIETVTDG